MTFLSSLLTDRRSSSASNPVILIQSSAAQSALPLLRGIIEAQKNYSLVLISSLYAPTQLQIQSQKIEDDTRIFDWTCQVRGFEDEGDEVDWKKRLSEIQSCVKEFKKPVAVVIDSVDTIDEDIESPSAAYNFISKILSTIVARKDSSRLILHISSLSPVLPLLKTHRFSPSLTHIIAHPLALLTHIASTYFVSPPQSSSSSSSDVLTPETLKFWSVFVPLSERPLDIERLVFNPSSSGTNTGSIRNDIRAGSITKTGESSDTLGEGDELVVEIIQRSRSSDAVPISGPFNNSSTSSGRRKGVERILEGWIISSSKSVPLEDLTSLRNVWRRKTMLDQEEPDPTKNLTFNLSLTDSQQASRAQVPLPYEHDGRKSQQLNNNANNEAQIFYDPDSADDLDDEDPDEDLDI